MTGKLKKATWCHEKTHRRQGKPDEHILGGKSASNFVSDAIQNSLDQRLDKKKPLTVRFKVNVLSNTKKKALLNAISWKDLEKHWGFDLSPHDYHKLRKLQNEYLSQNSRKHIVVMTVEESNAKGLTGSETDLHTNYERLIRGSHMPNTDKNSGGNFGWGKSVYFYYNLLQTAFFSSRHIDGNSGEVNLLVGRSYTPVRQNQNDGQLYATDSYFAHEIDADLNKWERLQGRDATPYQKRLNIKRKKTGNILNPDESGLSIMMPGFFIEDKDDNPIFDADRIIEEFYKANEELYWHQIQRGALKVYIDKLRDDNLQKTREVLDNPINSPLRFFMQAQNGPTNCKKINGSDQTSRKTFKGSESVTLPPKVDANLDPKQPYQPDFTLGFHSKSSSIVREENKPNKVAMIRGLGRVIEYVDIRPSFDSFNIFGVLEMGEAVSKSDKNKWNTAISNLDINFNNFSGLSGLA